MSETARRVIHPEIKVISATDGTVDYIASDESIDAHREIVSAKGWRFTRFAKNAPFVDSHNYWSLDALLGKVVNFEVKGGKLVERVKWAIDVKEAELAKLGFALTEGGYLKAVSVGFIPTKYAYQGDDDFAKAVAAMKLSAEDAVKVRCIYLEQEQIELSACIIGSNPNALAKAFQDGAVKEEMLAKLGFAGDEEMSFLMKAGELYEAADPIVQMMVRNEVARIYRARTLSPGQTPPAKSASKPGGADEAKRLADEQLQGLAKRLDALANKSAPKA